MIKNIRRSIKGGERHENFHSSKLSHASITPKSAITITPPKKVIKAIEAYVPVSEQELGFSKGDFFHVIGNENDTEWYEACNPATGARGYVPVPYFQVMGKNERDSQDFVSGRHNEKRSTTDADSGYSDRGSMPLERASTRAAAKGGSPLYGVVLYDFNAERPDELEAKRDEDIIVIAQSNDSWFVAKPIGRLGGPGLIPVDFVEIRDMATGVPVEDKKAAIARAGVPKVEEWKKMAAEYKNSSIALGQFEFDDDSQRAKHVSVHEDNFNRNTLHAYNSGLPDGNRNSRTVAPGPLVAPVSASVDDYNFENSRYWYVVNAVMEDGRSWSLCRFYEDFYDFQIALLDEFREEAGHTGLPRKLPYMPGPVTYVTDTISAARRQSLDDYIKKLLSMEAYISKCRLVKQLFAPRPGDVEQTQYRDLSGQDHRRSATSQLSSDSSREPSRQSSAHNLNGNPGGNSYPGLSAPPPRHSGGAQPRLGNGTIAQAQQVQIRNATASTTTSSGGGSGQFLKIKIEYQDEMIAVRLPKDVSFAQLQDKLQERLGAVNLNTIQYRDEASGQVMDMFGDNDLSNALSRNPKLKLFVN